MSSRRAGTLAVAALAAGVTLSLAQVRILAQAPQSTPRPAPRGVLPPQSPGGASAAQPARPPAATPTPVPTRAPTPAAVPADAATTPARTPTEAELGAPVYPGAVYLGSFDAGQGQRYHLFGTAATYAQVQTYYRATLKSKGEEVFDVPPIWTFDTGRFREQTMAAPPGVTIRDHVSAGGRGYLHAAGATPQRYATVIQIVPPPPGEARR